MAGILNIVDYNVGDQTNSSQRLKVYRFMVYAIERKGGTYAHTEPSYCQAVSVVEETTPEYQQKRD